MAKQSDLLTSAVLYINPRRCHIRPSICSRSLACTQSQRRRTAHLRAAQRKTAVGADVASCRRLFQPICLMLTSLDRFYCVLPPSDLTCQTESGEGQLGPASERTLWVCVRVRECELKIQGSACVDAIVQTLGFSHDVTRARWEIWTIWTRKQWREAVSVCVGATTQGNPGGSMNYFNDSSQGLCHWYGVFSTCWPLKAKVKWTLMPSQQEEGRSAALIRRVHRVWTELPSLGEELALLS